MPMTMRIFLVESSPENRLNPSMRRNPAATIQAAPTRIKIIEKENI
jgi:hypothetical protein